MSHKSKEDIGVAGGENLARFESVEQGKIIDLDERHLRAQGHNSELERSFSWLGAIALAYSISNLWLTYASCFGLVLIYGGGATTMFSLIIAASVQWIVFLGLGELCSAFPSSGGQYHFVYIIAPDKTRNFAAYVTGIINILGWWISTSSGLIYTAISAFGCAAVWFPDFAQKQWQVYLCYLGVIILSLIPIYTVKQRHIDYMTKAAMGFSLTGMILTIAVCLGMSNGNYAPGTILLENRGVSGWNPGVGWLLSIAAALYCFTANGAVTHIAEELPDPGRKLPQVLNMTMGMGLFVSIPWIAAMLLSIRDLEAVQSSFLPSIEVFYQATGSKAAATALQAYLTFLYYTCVPSQWVTCSRITWALARDHGLPFSKYWQHIDPKRGIPWRTTVLSAVFCTFYGLLYVASTAAFNSIINATCLMLNISYVVPQAILLVEGRDKLPRRTFDLGRWGYAVNLYSVIFLIVIGVVFCLPQTYPTTVGSMNYICRQTDDADEDSQPASSDDGVLDLPLTSIVRIPSPTQPRMERMLLHHYTNQVAFLLMPVDSEANPWRCVYPLVAVQQSSGASQSLYHALLSQSAFHLSVLHADDNAEKYKLRAMNHFYSALKLLLDSLGHEVQDFAACAAVLYTLTQIEGCYAPDLKGWRKHLSGMSGLVTMFSQSNPWMASSDSWVIAQSLAITFEIGYTGSGGFFDHLGITETSEILLRSVSVLDQFGYTIGASGAIIQMISQTRRLSLALSRGESSVQGHLQAKKIIDAIESSDPKPGSSITQTPDNRQEYLSSLHRRIFRNAAMIYLYRTIYDVPPKAIRVRISEVLRDTTEFFELQGGSVSLWPVFIAAVETGTEWEKDMVQKWLDYSCKLGISNRLAARRIIEHVWKLREEEAVLRGTSPQDVVVDWRKVQVELGIDLLLL
ncbi:Choline transport protein [Colletotrichum karsti]|uniref:Choline transport protein n=1 Tax=Colletotrichum karsti TaxID=1095194 RepID=A0A9P6HWX1_9PEZI|nr:Choline transport protein [Colletotrichum karsti]KAF9871507.1 Choline transport protein [Colletotrichum karsti]